MKPGLLVEVARTPSAFAVLFVPLLLIRVFKSTTTVPWKVALLTTQVLPFSVKFVFEAVTMLVTLVT